MKSEFRVNQWPIKNDNGDTVGKVEVWWRACRYVIEQDGRYVVSHMIVTPETDPAYNKVRLAYAGWVCQLARELAKKESAKLRYVAPKR